MQYPVPICLRCKHFIEDEDLFRCAAFEDGIPFAISSSEHDHTEPYPGDNGIQFEPIDEAQEDESA